MDGQGCFAGWAVEALRLCAAVLTNSLVCVKCVAEAYCSVSMDYASGYVSSESSSLALHIHTFSLIAASATEDRPTVRHVAGEERGAVGTSSTDRAARAGTHRG
jgi:hypothetical protein